MSTPATIVVKCNDRYYESCVNYDGDLLPPLLKKHYGTPELAEQLVKLGDASFLAESLEAPEGHSFESPVRGRGVFYARDRGEEWRRVGPRTYNSLNELRKCAEYLYLYEDGRWFIAASGRVLLDNGTRGFRWAEL